MLDRIHGLIVFECDGKSCHEALETETSDFPTARNMLDEQDWECRFVNGQWHHVCPTCIETETPTI